MRRVLSIVVLAFLVTSAMTPAWAARPTPKEWTLAVFLNADNNLDEFGVEDQDEMAKVGSNDWLNIVSLIDRENGPACYNYIEKGNIKKLEDAGELDMGDYKLLVKFMKWVVEKYPAKKYVLTIWNHGSGWKQAGHPAILRGISYDDSSNNHITTEELGTALKEIKKLVGHNVDILNFDACLMQMAEVAYVCKDTVDYIVASEETEPGKGTPYDDVFKTLTESSTPEAFAKSWTKAFVASYSKGSQGIEDCTQSALKCSTLAGLYDAIDGFAKTAMGGKFSTEFATALNRVQTFAYPENIDLIDFVTLIKAAVKDPAMQTACEKLLSACKAVIIQNNNTGFSMKNAKGIAIYLPSDYSMESGYTNLSFCKNSMWDDMISDLGKKATAENIVNSIEKADLDSLKDFVTKSAEVSTDLKKLVVGEVNFRVHTEGGLPENIKKEASELVNQLIAK